MSANEQDATGPHAGKVIWVTGASGALGEAVARRLASQGAQVIASARSVAQTDFGDDASAAHIERFALDITDTEAVNAAAREIAARYGRIDGAVASTNVASFGDFTELDDDAWYRVVEAKLLGTVRLFRAVLPVLIEQKRGALVAISGRGGIDPPPQHFPGASINASLDTLVQGIGRLYGPHGVRANSVAPGPIRSPRYDQLEQADTSKAGARANRYSDVALGAPGEPGDVADAVSYLLSDAARFVNGTRLFVDGGGPGYAR